MQKVSGKQANYLPFILAVSTVPSVGVHFPLMPLKTREGRFGVHTRTSQIAGFIVYGNTILKGQKTQLNIRFVSVERNSDLFSAQSQIRPTLSMIKWPTRLRN